MRPTLLTLLLLGCAAERNPRTTDPELARTLKQQLKAQAELMTRATETEDHDAFINYTHPKLVELMGGRAQMRARLVEMAGELREFEKKIQMDEPSDLVESNGHWYGVIPYTLSMSGRGRNVSTPSAFVGVSTDGGKSWRFIDVQPRNVDAVREQFPEIPRDLNISPR